MYKQSRRITLLPFLWMMTLLAGCSAGRATPTAASPTLPPTPFSVEMPELAEFFQGNTGAFVLFNRNDDRFIRYNPERCSTAFLPASTFKILNSLIGLETGVIQDENFKIKWDGTPYDVPSWNQDQTLKTAIQNSVVWYYQEVARRIGPESMQHYVELTDYGNNDTSGKIDTFWLEGALRISADQQVDFLRRFYQNELPFSTRSTDIVRQILVLEQTDAYTFSGKTGSVQRTAIFTGWFVGYLERDDNVYFFATNLESKNVDGFANGAAALKITRDILTELGLLSPR